MLTMVVILLIVGGLWYGLRRDHSHADPVRRRMSGSSDVADRDVERVRAELMVAACRETVPQTVPERQGWLARLRSLHLLR